MALFEGEELVDVSFNGRSLKLPRSVANALQGGAAQQDIGPGPTGAPPLVEAPQPAPVPMPTTAPDPGPQQSEPGVFDANMTPIDVTAPAPAPSDAMPQNSADFQAKNLPKPFKKAQADASKPLPKQKTAPAPKQMSSTDQLRQVGIGGALEEQVGALAEQRTAALSSADIEAAGQTLIADEYAKRNIELDKMFAKRAADAEADMRATEAKTAEYTKLREKIANTKIDRTADHPVLGAIGMILAGLGTAMKKESVNPAIELFWKSIDRKVAGQMADLEQKGKVLGFQREEIALLKESASNRLAMNNLMVAGEAEKAARHIEEMTARTSSATLKANGLKVAAEIRGRAADLTMVAVQAQMGHDQREKFQKQEMGYKYSSLAENKRQHNDEMQFKREQLWADTTKALAAERAKGGIEAEKAFQAQKDKVEGRGIKNITTNEYLLTNKGRAMMDEAAKLDEAAKAIEAKGVFDANDSARMTMMREKAEILRGQANVMHAVVHRDPTQAGRLGSQYTATQKITDLSANIAALYKEHGRAYFSTGPGQAAIQSMATDLTMALKTAWGLGVLSKQDVQLVEAATGGAKITDGWDVGNAAHMLGLNLGTDPEAFKKRIETIAASARESVYDEIKAQTTYDGKDREELFRIKKEPGQSEVLDAVKTIEQEKTPGEAADEVRNESTATTVANRVRNNVFSTGKDERANAAENSGSWKHLGLSEAQGKAVDKLITKHRSGDKTAAEQLAIQAGSKREQVALGTLRAVREADPELYIKLRKNASPAVEKSLQTEEEAGRAKAKMQPTIKGVTDIGGNIASNLAKQEVLAKVPVVDLAKQAVIGREDSFEELSRRAGAGDQEARGALEGVIKLRERRANQVSPYTFGGKPLATPPTMKVQ